MNPLIPCTLFIATFATAWVGVGLFRRWSLRKELVDVPNERSSHSVPTPSGAGIVIGAVTLAGYVASSLITDLPLSYGYLVGAAMICLISWLDDLMSIPYWGRFGVHILGSGLLIADVGYWNEIFIPAIDVTIPLGPIAGLVVTMGWLVWFITAFNFMDGIDGIAGLQAVVAGVAWAVLSSSLGLEGTFLFAGIVACSALGFLVHNWSPARIFMGDAGAAFLGFTLAAMPLLAQSGSPASDVVLPIVGVLFVWFFLFDSSITLVRRFWKGHRVWAEPAREHYYQKMVISDWKHSSVALIYGSAAAILSFTVITAIIFQGKYSLLVLLSLLTSTFLLIYLGTRKNH